MKIKENIFENQKYQMTNSRIGLNEKIESLRDLLRWSAFIPVVISYNAKY